MEPFAIVGVSLKMPQEAVSESSLWEVIENRRNLMTEWPESRAEVDAFHDGGSKKPNTLHGRGGHFIAEDPAVFDASFFSISPREAAAMDPQQRWALEAAYHAFENAGMTSNAISGTRTGVFASSFSDDYARMLSKDPDCAPRHTGIGTACSIVPNRLSWFFNLRGPSIHVDTACSSGLVALDMACQSMRCGDAAAALVVGTSLLLSPEITTLLANMSFLSPDSRCYSFDARANGFARGEGIIALVIKPLKDALANGDTIRAIIRATASNQDGRTLGLTQPSAEAQESLIRHVYQKAGLSLDSTRYLEAHGTGTVVGDPIEMKAIGRVFRTSRSPEHPLYVGSIKANVGHLEPASGLAGIVKCMLMLERGTIPPNALFERLNPEIDAHFFNLEVPTKCIPWPVDGIRRASVNSFGFGGTNSHVVLDDALHFLQSRGLTGFHHGVMDKPSSIGTNSTKLTNGEGNKTNGTHSRKNTGPKLLIWSAADAAALDRMKEAYQEYYNKQIVGHDDRLDRLSYTLGARRSIMSWRTFCVVEGSQQLNMAKSSRAASTEDVSIAFIFTGQGAQYAGMGLELLRYPVFAESLRKSDKILTGLGCPWSIFDVITSQDRIHSPEVSQPLCTALQVALVQLSRTFGVSPVAVVGHSSGEIAAAYTVGALSHESACKVAYYRGQVADKIRRAASSNGNPGAMMSVNWAEDQVQGWLDHLEIPRSTIHISCINSPTNVTLSGSSGAIDALKSRLDRLEIFAQKINTGVAYHSPDMLVVASEYREAMGSLEADSEYGCQDTPVQPVPCTMISSVTGGVSGPVAKKLLRSPQYWVDNLVSPVRFADAVRSLGSVSDSTTRPLSVLPLGVGAITDVVEVGPHAALRRPVRDTISPSVRYHSLLQRAKSPLQTTLEVLGTLFCHGHDVSVLAANSQSPRTLPPLVDCPPYPFDHSRRYWAEPRISRDYRLRPRAQGYVLGRRAHDWNPLQPRWRNWLNAETLPWLGDHAVNDKVVFPGTGMLSMAAEAAVQVASNANRALSGLLVKNAQFIAPIIVGDNLGESTEVMIELRPIQNVYEKESPGSEVLIFSYTDNTWRLSFRAEIQTQYQDTVKENQTWADEEHHERTRIREHVESATMTCARRLDSRLFYNFCEKNGVRYGPSFQLLSDIEWDGNDTSTARIDITAASLNEDSSGPVHPAILDAALHLLVVQASKGISQAVPTFVPKQVSNIWISPKVWHQSTSSIHVCSFASVDRGPFSTSKGNVYLVDDNGSALCTIEGLVMAEVSMPSQMDGSTLEEGRTLLHNIIWKPNLSSLAATEIQQLCNAAVSNVDRDETVWERFYPKIEMAMRASARQALRELSREDIDRAPAYLQKYVASLEHHFGDTHDDEGEAMSDSALESLLQECETEQPHWRMFTAVARSLVSIVRGETNALDLLFSSKSAEDFYGHSFGKMGSDSRLSRFLDLASHENPNLRMLEVGAGTGSMTRSILATLQEFERETGQTRFSEFAYTDISPSFFEEARGKFHDFADRMSFKTLDLETDPVEQGFQAASYDLILAGSVLHVTTDLVATLNKVRRLLKPGGRLVFLEITTLDSACAMVGFGCLEGWWFGNEPWRRYTPLATEERWDESLRQAGFSGVEMSIRDFESDICHLTSIMVSKTLPDCPKKILNGGPLNGSLVNGHSTDNDSKEITILMEPGSEAQKSVADEIMRHHPLVRTIYWKGDGEKQQQPLRSQSSLVISLIEVGASRLACLDETDFSALKAHIEEFQDILWVTSPGEDHGYNPHLALATGLFRALRNEEDSKHIITLSIESGASGKEASYVLQILSSCFFDTPVSPEVEFIVRDGYVNVGRLMEEKSLDAERLSRTLPQTISEPWEAGGRRLALEVRTPGMLDTLEFVEDTTDDLLAAKEVEIKAAVWPVSFRDVFVALGRLGNEGMGFECAGTVSRVGTAAAAEFRPGERVLMVVPGCMRSHPRASADAVFKLPDSLSFHDAVAGMNPGMTAWYALVDVARLQRGEKVLIHAAAGSTGQMAVKIAKRLGAEVFVTVGSEEKKRLVTDPHGLSIPESHVFCSRNTAFMKGIMRVTSGYGVDVVLNSLSGSGLRATWQCMAPYGRFVDIGKSDIQANSSLPMAGFARNVTFASADLHYTALRNKALTRRLIEKILELSADPKVGVPGPLHLFPVSDIEKALRYMQSGTNTGRILVTMDPGCVVSKRLVKKSTWEFDPHVSYLVAGGLGGLGRPIIRWMCDRGVKNLIIPSRSGTSSAAAQDVVSELTRKGVNIKTPSCDLSSTSELENLLRDCQDNMPPIKGCINLSMVLQDAIFEAMTHEQWAKAVQAKVETSWNLHKLLGSTSMDFFILMSSLGGIYGSPSQANYDAGNTFQDALARFRAGSSGDADRKPGTTVSIDLGWMQDVGWVVESSELEQTHLRRLARALVPIQLRDLLALLEHYCDPTISPPAGPDQSQVLVGLKTPADFLTQGEPVPTLFQRPMFAPFRVTRPHAARSQKGMAGSRQEDARQLFQEARSAKERADVVVEALKNKLGRALGMQDEDIDTDKSLTDYGVDSLMAVELRNWIWWGFHASVTVFDIMSPARDIKGVGQLVVEQAE